MDRRGEKAGSCLDRQRHVCFAEAPRVVSSATCERPTDTVIDGIDVTRAEFEYAITHEGALDVADIVDRRTRIGLVAADRERVVGVAEEFLAAAR